MILRPAWANRLINHVVFNQGDELEGQRADILQPRTRSPMPGWACSCGSGEQFRLPPPDYEAALAGAPKPLAARAARSGLLRRRARFETDTALRGYPVVVNQWASCAGPCRAESLVSEGLREYKRGVSRVDSGPTLRRRSGRGPGPLSQLHWPTRTSVAKATLGLPTPPSRLEGHARVHEAGLTDQALAPTSVTTRCRVERAARPKRIIRA